MVSTFSFRGCRIEQTSACILRRISSSTDGVGSVGLNGHLNKFSLDYVEKEDE